MDIYYYKRCVIKVTDGDENTARYLVLVDRSKTIYPGIRTWTPLTTDTFTEDILENSTKFLLMKEDFLNLVNSMNLSSSSDRHGRYQILTTIRDDKGFTDWIMDGFKTAMTVEEHLMVGNEIRVLRHYHGSVKSNIYIKTSEDLIVLNDKQQASNPAKLCLSFYRESLNLKSKDAADQDSYVVKILFHESFNSLLHSVASGLLLKANCNANVKRFPTEIKALNYCEKHQNIMGEYSFEILNVGNGKNLEYIIDNYGNTLI